MSTIIVTANFWGGVTKEWIEAGQWEIELAWQRYPARVQLQSFYDPKGEKIKA
jgi:4-methylaminobutanoate oxidase (formaldehyde-forming)